MPIGPICTRSFGVTGLRVLSNKVSKDGMYGMFVSTLCALASAVFGKRVFTEAGNVYKDETDSYQNALRV